MKVFIIDSILFGFHKMNRFVGMEQREGFYFYDLEKMLHKIG